MPDKTKSKRKIKLPSIVYDIAEIFEIENRLPEKDRAEPKPLPLEIQAFDRVPMANLLAVFPKTKLIFRPADAFIFDLVNITTFLAVVSSVRFDSTKLDILAFVSVVLWILRTFFRYSNKIARYDLLVNKFLTGRISRRNTGAFQYTLNEGAVQRARRAVMVHEWLVQRVEKETYGALLTRDDIIRVGISEINELNQQEQQQQQPIQLDLNAALADLVELKLIRFGNDEVLLEVKQGENARDTLQESWNSLLPRGRDMN